MNVEIVLFLIFLEQVFEDPTQGIICYTDDNGEVICEGYDEGPRCPTQSPMVASYSRYDKFPNPKFIDQSCFKVLNKWILV